MPSVSRENSATRRLSAFFLPTSSGSKLRPEIQNNSTADLRVRGRSPARRLTRNDRGSSVYPPSSAPRSPTFGSTPRRSVSIRDAFRDPLVLLQPPPIHIEGAVSGPPSPALSRINSRSLSASHIPSLGPPTWPGAQDKRTKRRSWFPSSKSKFRVEEQPPPRAWVVGHPTKEPYDILELVNGVKVAELWDEYGDTLVYLFPRSYGKGPSFKLNSSIYASSPSLTQYAYGRKYIERRVVSAPTGKGSQFPGPPRQNISLNGLLTPPTTPKGVHTDNSSSSGSSRGERGVEDFSDETPRQMTLYLPIRLTSNGGAPSPIDADDPLAEEDIETLIAMRNLFAFLVGQSLVATEKRPDVFSIFTKISEALKFYGFTNLDGSTFGEVAATSFDHYVDELRLGDVRFSREKTIEGILLGERMRSVMLYNEAFVHAVGKYDDIQYVSNLPGAQSKFGQISSTTRNRLERASIDLAHRERSIDIRLSDFDFPSIFSGIMSSKMADERKVIQFSAWKDSFLATRRHVMSYYRVKYGSWPPRASSKRNSLETNGLNRLVLKELYHDFADLYDLFVDRTSLTTRSTDLVSEDVIDDSEEPVPRVLRRVFDEYDRSSPPVQPPVPFDTPLLPSLALIRKDYGIDSRRDARERTKKLKSDEVAHILQSSCNPDTLPAIERSQFLASIRRFERREAAGCTVIELVNLRAGIWMFMYAVLQSLPMLVVDAPGIKYHGGVEYFLCEPPRSGVPWATGEAGSSRGRKNWYGVSGGFGVVSLPSDLVEHGVEGVYRRSHCWVVAQKWNANLFVAGPQAVAGAPEAQDEVTRNSLQKVRSPLAPPPVLTEGFGGSSAAVVRPGSSGRNSRASSPNRRGNRDSIVALGLQALPMPHGVVPSGSSGGWTHTAPPSVWTGGSASRANSRPRPASRAASGSYDHSAASVGTTGATFDDIIGEIDREREKVEAARLGKKAIRRSK